MLLGGWSNSWAERVRWRSSSLAGKTRRSQRKTHRGERMSCQKRGEEKEGNYV